MSTLYWPSPETSGSHFLCLALPGVCRPFVTRQSDWHSVPSPFPRKGNLVVWCGTAANPWDKIAFQAGPTCFNFYQNWTQQIHHHALEPEEFESPFGLLLIDETQAWSFERMTPLSGHSSGRITLGYKAYEPQFMLCEYQILKNLMSNP